MLPPRQVLSDLSSVEKAMQQSSKPNKDKREEPVFAPDCRTSVTEREKGSFGFLYEDLFYAHHVFNELGGLREPRLRASALSSISLRLCIEEGASIQKTKGGCQEVWSHYSTHHNFFTPKRRCWSHTGDVASGGCNSTHPTSSQCSKLTVSYQTRR
jgi:hypothetical protein